MMLNVYFYPSATILEPTELTDLLDENVLVTISEELPDPAEYHVLINAFATREQLEASPNLHTLITPFAGMIPDTLALMKEFPHVKPHNLPYNSVPTAETALALVLGCSKFVALADRKLRQNDWSIRYSEQPQIVLRGKTVMILGYGRAGRHLAPIFHALGMRVLGVRSTVQAEDRADPHATVHGTDELHDLLPRANVVVSTLPGTSETDGILGAREFDLLPRNAIVVNVGRGSVLDEEALYNALKDGKLGGAGIDVWYQYPRTVEARTNTAPSRFPFHELDNVIMSPHHAGWLGKEDGGRMPMLADMLNAAARGEPMPNSVNIERGY